MSWRGLCIVVEELVANLYDHGGLTPDGRGRAELFAANRTAFEVAIDRSRHAVRSLERTANSGERRERGGGAGIDIVRAWAQLISYDLTTGGNRLEFLLPVTETGRLKSARSPW